MEDFELFDVAENIMGRCGRLLSMSKSAYSNNRQGNIVVYNGNLFIKQDKKYQKIWYGDIDVSREILNLTKLADKLKTTVYLLREMDGRFENEAKPKIEKAVISVDPDGTHTERCWI